MLWHSARAVNKLAGGSIQLAEGKRTANYRSAHTVLAAASINRPHHNARERPFRPALSPVAECAGQIAFQMHRPGAIANERELN